MIDLKVNFKPMIVTGVAPAMKDNAPPPTASLLERVLQAAREAGLDQATLAARAGVAPETISRAKRRSDIDLSTLHRLARIVGLEVGLHARTTTAANSPNDRQAALRAPRWGLAWSNRHADEAVLLRNALARGQFEAVLEAAATDGTAFVREQILRLHHDRIIDDTHRAELMRMAANIEAGFAHAA